MRELYTHLKECYSLQAEHFWHTRKKFWPELSYIKEAISGKATSRKLQAVSTFSNFSILELGCGVGRETLFDELAIVFGEQKWDYVGIDNAPWMIEQAKKQKYGGKKNIEFACVDMIEYVRSLEDESVDVVLGIASAQHLMTSEERQLLRQHIYRVLKRDGKMILTNRSYSAWFLKKYWKEQLKTLCRACRTLGTWKRNDLIISWKDPWFQQNQKSRERYYHMFTLYELEQLSLLSWFVVEKLWYIQQEGGWSEHNWRGSRNSFLVAGKKIEKLKWD